MINWRSQLPQDRDTDLFIEERRVADQEAKNGLLQFDRVLRLLGEAVKTKSFLLTPEIISDLNYWAIQGIRRSAGKFRQCPIYIGNTSHNPPEHVHVPELMGDMCAYVEHNWSTPKGDLSDAIHLSAFLMWRINWIHPYTDGNGRTSRAVSYLVLSARLMQLLPGEPTIADQIVQDKQPYYAAIDEADAAWKKEIVDVSSMEALIYKMLELQLASATG